MKNGVLVHVSDATKALRIGARAQCRVSLCGYCAHIDYTSEQCLPRFVLWHNSGQQQQWHQQQQQHQERKQQRHQQ